jgi:hypothetical protein
MIHWDGFLLPEHRAGLADKREKEKRFICPELDEQQREEIDYALQFAFVEEQPVIVTYAGKYQKLDFCGYIDRIDRQQQCLQLSNGKQQVNISFEQLLHIALTRS